MYLTSVIVSGVFIKSYAAMGYPTEMSSARENGDIRNCSASPPYLPATAINTTERLTALRRQMSHHNLSAYIIPATDAHMSEYIAKRDGRLEWISGFSGSAGTVVVSLMGAALWTDSRYWIQAERQMDCNWQLLQSVDISSILSWILEKTPDGGTIGFDPFLFSIDSWESYNRTFQRSKRTLTPLVQNLVDVVWGTSRPPPPTEKIYHLSDEFTGCSWKEKVSNIRSQMNSHPRKPTAVLLSALDETAWLFNLRSRDIQYNPFFYSYTLLTNTSISLFVNGSRLDSEVKQYLNTECKADLCVQIQDYDQVQDSIRKYAEEDVRIWIGTEYTTYGLYGVIPQEKLVAEPYSPVMMTKAVKNQKEQELLRAAHVRDAVAVIRYLVWLEKNVPKGTVNEFSGAVYVDQLRREEKYCDGPSFETISASGLNAALAHYSPSNETHRMLSHNEMYLLDSGGQYWDGTTDITRTVHWGKPSSFQKEAYTRVLMGNIDLSRLVFPFKTSGRIMEAFARHGVGNFLTVHESSNNIAMTQGMFTLHRCKPGYYHDGEFWNPS
uniref:X-prolyl aminopeptidase 2 n=1 Tax=Ornithorhynchus anatinus TaxID=9258 RepID=F7EE27_ORNAN